MAGLVSLMTVAMMSLFLLSLLLLLLSVLFLLRPRLWFLYCRCNGLQRRRSARLALGHQLCRRGRRPDRLSHLAQSVHL